MQTASQAKGLTPVCTASLWRRGHHGTVPSRSR
jgi:hypothetical protein